MPVSPTWRTVRSPLPGSWVRSAPIRASTSMKPERAGPEYTLPTTTSDPGTIDAATAQKAAWDGSPATSWSNGAGHPGFTVTLSRGPSVSRTIGIPVAAISSSVWVRDNRSSTTVVGPSADSPANRTQPFTWALATGKRYSIPRRPPPSMVSGARPEPSRPDTLAPMRARGSRTRSMGRRRIEASPSSTDRKGSPASSPASSRIPVPELPTSSVPSAGSRPLPPTRRVHGPSSATVVPRASMIRRVQATSSPSLRPRIVDVPSARPASISTRCEIDLSPGTRTRPTNGPPGSTTRVLTGRPSRQGG